jgi:hypothetical protein
MWIPQAWRGNLWMRKRDISETLVWATRCQLSQQILCYFRNAPGSWIWPRVKEGSQNEPPVSDKGGWKMKRIWFCLWSVWLALERVVSEISACCKYADRLYTCRSISIYVYLHVYTLFVPPPPNPPPTPRFQDEPVLPFHYQKCFIILLCLGGISLNYRIKQSSGVKSNAN